MTPATLSRATAVSALREPSRHEERRDPLLRHLDAVPPGRLLSLTLPAPVVAVETLLEAAMAIGLDAADHGMVWQPPDGPSWAGVGVCSRLQLTGANRFKDLRRHAGEVFERLDRLAVGGAEAPDPRFFGGFAFDTGAADAAPWESFGDSCFTLPRWLYRRHGLSADLTLSVRGDEIDPARSDAWATRLDALLEALKVHGGGPRAIDNSPADLGSSEMPRVLENPAGDRAWIRLVDDIRRAIRDGEVEKIVAARRFTVELDSSRSISRMLAHLAQHRRASTSFAFCRPGAAFVGLTPERLITKRGLQLETEALAGSIESGGEHAAELMGSGKDRLEQQLVVDAIARRLEPLCSQLEVAARPSVRELRDVLHLHTPIVGTLAAPRHVLELAELLHPTPAVGGVPTVEAMSWIAEREAHPRGWYASPVGWFDAAGDGELAVALRSCLLQPDRAYLYAGAGIVADSDPRRELDEVELKLQTLLQALVS